MDLFDRLSFRGKLIFLAGVAIAGLAFSAAVTYFTLQAVCIHSPMYNDIALGYQLAGDCYDPPASLVAALPLAIAAEDADTPEATRKYVVQLRQTRQAFEDSQHHYQNVLPAGAIRNLLQQESYPAGEQWFAVAESSYIPALLAGDHEAARRLRIEKMNPLFARHKAANDKLSQLTADWIPAQEKNAATIIHWRSIVLGLTFASVAAVLFLLGHRIMRSIVYIL